MFAFSAKYRPSVAISSLVSRTSVNSGLCRYSDRFGQLPSVSS